jgi:tetratricopeptide (TPR) repeat protein
VLRSALLALFVVAGSAGCKLGPKPLEHAALLASRGDEAEAIRVLAEHLEEHPDARDERRLLIRLYGSVGRLDVARTQTERLAEILGPASPVPWVELGHAYELAHRYDEALASYDRGAQVAPDDPLGPKQGGMRAARWGELALAEPRLLEALRRAPRDAEAWHALGLVRAGLGQLHEARAAYESGLRANPLALENRLGLATVALRLEQPSAALRQYEALIRERPTYTDAWLGKSWTLIVLGELDAAEATLEQARALGADASSIARQRGAIAERRRKSRD